MSDSFITKYRPQVLEDVVGQDAIVRSLQALLKKKASQTFLFTGPSGTGKTTLARIVASEIGCRSASDLTEIDVATQTGVDDMRNLVAGLRYRPLGENAVKAIICNEAHMLSKSAWNSLLMELEEPKPWVAWFLCTTEPSRVPENIRTRCTRYDLKSVSLMELIELLDYVADEEDLTVGKKVIEICAKEANGSPRQALTNLAVCATAKDYEECVLLLQSAIETNEAIDLARALAQGKKWADVQELLKGLKEANPESVRHVVRSYFTTVVLNSKTEQQAGRGLELLSLFDTPFNTADGMSPLVLACGRALLEG